MIDVNSMYSKILKVAIKVKMALFVVLGLNNIKLRGKIKKYFWNG